MFGGKGTLQIGKGNQAVTASTTGANSPVTAAAGNIINNYNLPFPQAPVPEDSLGQQARELLLEAAADPSGSFMRVPNLDAVTVKTTNKKFSSNGDPKRRAELEHAVQELEGFGLIQARGYKRTIYDVTQEGYRVAKVLRGETQL
jgi:hypothetical protein